MNRASLILKNAREDKELDLAEVSKKLKINRQYLEAIESESIASFPSEPYCSLIIKDYASFLGLNGDDLLSLFRRDFVTPSNHKNLHINQTSITPQVAFKFALVISVLIFFGYIFSEYLKFNRPPNLEVSWPDEKKVTPESILEISGKTDPEATVRINDDLIIIDQSGKFSQKIDIENTELKIKIESKSPSGKITQVEKIYRP